MKRFSTRPVLLSIILLCLHFLSAAQTSAAQAAGAAAAPSAQAEQGQPLTLPAPTPAAPTPSGPAQGATTPAAPGGAAPAGAAAAAQTAPGSTAYTIQRTTRLVVLDMVVTDARGKAVSGLTRDDFHVDEAGAPQTILNFETAGVHTPDPGLVINSTADLDRLAPRAPVNIILLDEFNTRFEDMAFARYSLKKYLNRLPGKLDTPTMLIAVDLQHFTVLHDYTQNKDDNLSALDHHFVAFIWQAHPAAWLGDPLRHSVRYVKAGGRSCDWAPCHKNMIWIGRGFPPINFANLPIDTEDRV